MRAVLLLLVISTATLLVGGVNAAPTGLNIIPIAEVLPSGDASLELEFVSIDDEDSTHVLAQVGIGRGLEVGVDRCARSGETLSNVKWLIRDESEHRPAVAAGVQCIGDGLRSEPYIVGMKSMGDTRMHLGAISIGGKAQAIVGLDHPVGNSLLLQADFISGSEHLFALGAAVDLGRNLSLTGAVLAPKASSRGHLINLAWSVSR